MTAHNPLRVLILDDERIIVDTLCVVLKQGGYDARGTYTHDSAVSLAREFQPDAFLTGFLNHCKQNGCETAAEVLTFLPKCRIFIFSGTSAAGPVIEDYRRRGYNFEIFAKPLHPEILLAGLRSLEPPATGLAETTPVPQA